MSVQNRRISIGIYPLLLIFLSSLVPIIAISDEQPNWKLGRVYHRMTCTACHNELIGHGISPNTRTQSEWRDYIDADKHDATGRAEPTLSFYTSRAYRESVKDSNAAAEKFLELPEDELFANVGAYLIRGAKDSDTPMRCQ